MPRSNKIAVSLVACAILFGASFPAKPQAVTSPSDHSSAAQAQPRASELRLKGAIEKIQSGAPNYDEMEPLLRAAVQNQYSVVQPKLASLGKIKSIEYMGAQNGQDIYNVKFESGALAWGILLSANGKISALFFN